MKTLVLDPGFSLDSVEFLLNMQNHHVMNAWQERGPTLPYTKSKDKKFISLEDCERLANLVL